MLLVIDVSNTNMVLGVFNGENLVANWRLSTKRFAACLHILMFL